MTSKDERPKGYFGTPYATTVLQVKAGSRWVKIRGTRGAANRRGLTVQKARYDRSKPARVRAFTPRTDDLAPSGSGVIKLR